MVIKVDNLNIRRTILKLCAWKFIDRTKSKGWRPKDFSAQDVDHKKLKQIMKLDEFVRRFHPLRPLGTPAAVLEPRLGFPQIRASGAFPSKARKTLLERRMKMQMSILDVNAEVRLFGLPGRPIPTNPAMGQQLSCKGQTLRKVVEMRPRSQQFVPRRTKMQIVQSREEEDLEEVEAEADADAALILMRMSRAGLGEHSEEA